MCSSCVRDCIERCVGPSVSLISLGRGVFRREHGPLAIATLSSAFFVYVVMLDLWLQVPGPIVDPRMMYTVGLARVPLYVSFLALVGHMYLWMAKRRAVTQVVGLTGDTH